MGQSNTNDTTVAFARLYGEPLTALPADLYIPPEALEILLETFEGPLDLLLYLIRKQRFNILDIPMGPLTLQYVDYVERLRRRNIALAADYLLMAAMLIDIKSRMLLPVQNATNDEEALDPRAALVERLLAYEDIKLAALALDTLPQRGRDFFLPHVHNESGESPVWPKVHAADLHAAFVGILEQAAHQRQVTMHHTIHREELSVREHMAQILRKLQLLQVQSVAFIEFADLFEPAHPGPKLIVHFIALLELAKETLIDITQTAPFAPIYIRLSYLPQA